VQTASEIESAINNIRYYTGKIEELSRQQFNMDCERAAQLGINTDPGALRFDCLGAIKANCDWIETYCDGIVNNLKIAAEQDKILHVEEEESGRLI